MKAVLNAPATQNAIAFLVANYLRFAGWTMRWQVIGRDAAEAAWQGDDGVICCFWHGRLLYAPKIWPTRTQPVAVLASRSRDGDMITNITERFGIRSIRGSSSNSKKDQDKGALRAFRDMVAQVKSGHAMAITPDGPRGPRMRAASGVARLAKTTRATVLPFTWSSTNARQFKSWDRMMLPMPFGRGVIIWADPIEIPDRLDADGVEALRLRIEASLNDITRRADALCGRDPVEPD